MIRASIIVAGFFLSGAACWAETVVLERTVRAHGIITMDDLRLIDQTIPGTISDPNQIAGLEARSILYAGRPIRKGDVGPPAVIERNQLVELVFSSGTLVIATEGRSLARASIGERVKALNLASRSTVTGVVDDFGRIVVGP
ncbi:MAG: flagellar basal body P-ring formation chaperone FlgA [Pseudomonadota bacterium]